MLSFYFDVPEFSFLKYCNAKIFFVERPTDKIKDVCLQKILKALLIGSWCNHSILKL